MYQYDFQISDIVRILRKRYKIIAVTTAATLMMSVIIVKTRPFTYRSSTVLKYDNRGIISGLDAETAMAFYDYLDDIGKVAYDLSSYPVLLRAAKSLNLISDSISEDIRMANDSVQNIVQMIGSRITVQTDPSSNTITLSATGSNPLEARNLANAAACSFREFSFEKKRKHILNTKRFIQKQLDRLAVELSEVESELVAFEAKKPISLMGDNINRMISQSDRIEEIIEDLKNRLDNIEIQRKRLISVTAKSADNEKKTSEVDKFVWISDLIDNDPGILQLNNRLINKQIERDNLLAYYKPDHPMIASLEISIRETAEQLRLELDKKASLLRFKLIKLAAQRKRIKTEIRHVPNSEIDYNRLKRRYNVKEELYTMFSKKLHEINIIEAGIIDDIHIVMPARLPDQPVNDDFLKSIGIGFLIGLIIGILAVILLEMFDTSIGTIEEVEMTMKLPVIAVIPLFSSNGRRRGLSSRKKTGSPEAQSTLVTHFNPKEFSSESFRILRTNIDFYCIEKKYQTFLLTSSTAGEGKSIIAANLGIAFAQQGQKTLLLECNLRRPSLELLFGTSRGTGLSDILIEKVKWEDCIITVTDLVLGKMRLGDILSTPGLHNFYLIPHGHTPTNPTELLSSSRMRQLLGVLKEDFDIILVDAPPIITVADSIVLSKIVDSVILVYKIGIVPRKTFQICKERLDAVQANILGVVLNGVSPANVEYAC